MSDTHAARAAHDPAEIDRHVRTYIMVFATLMVLTLVTVAVSYLHLEIHEAVAIALLIATVKASLVALFFMHLVSERQVVLSILALTGFFAVALLLLPVVTNLDHITTADMPVGATAGAHSSESAHH
ncbi:MAG: cytochrome C oxidase subunit IV family protein [Deltaproteobacteria bacterium]|nr:cytochrome C oxidase subunit IV family protein [Deltaproteobacteria bacterium]